MTTTTTVAEATNGGTNWELVFVGITAAATMLLALATAVLAAGTKRTAEGTKELAQETRRLAELTDTEVKAVLRQVEVGSEQVDAARQDVAVSRAAHEGRVRPALISVPPGLFINETNFYVNVPTVPERRGFTDQAAVLVEQVHDRLLFVSVGSVTKGKESPSCEVRGSSGATRITSGVVRSARPRSLLRRSCESRSA